MRLTVATLCDAATVRENLLHILGAGTNQIQRPMFPAPLGVMLALQLLADVEDVQADHQISVSIVDDANVEHAKAIALLSLKGDYVPTQAEVEGIPIFVPLVIAIGQAILPKPGRYELRIDLDGEMVMMLPVFMAQMTNELAPPTTTPRATLDEH